MPHLKGDRNYYEVLELTSTASPQDIREAYLKTKTAYTRDNPALYTLINREEREQALEEIEAAYQVLSNPEQRHSYDENFNPMDPVPPMANPLALFSEDDLLIPPTVEIPPEPKLERPVVISSVPKIEAVLIQLIEEETEWRGDFLRKIRENLAVSIEELSSSTKIPKSYILAIECEDYLKLPASVYVRGFLVQIARVLKLPQERVAKAYLSRYSGSHSE